MSAQGSVWPDRLRIRDTGLHDDMGGLGQSVYTTACQGYEKREYVRADLLASAIKERDEAYARVEVLEREMRRYLPLLEFAEELPVWYAMTKGTGIATLNSYRAALSPPAKEPL